MIFIFDTNVLISACIKPNGVPSKALKRAQAIGQIIFSQATLTEFQNVVARPFFRKYLDEEWYNEITRRITMEALITKPFVNTGIKCRDENDIKFLELAASTKADCIITGDMDLLILHPFQGIPILNSADFLNHFS